MSKRKQQLLTRAHPNGDRAAVLATLDMDDVAALRVRYELWKHEEQLVGMLQESYVTKVREIRTKYELPARFEVDFETGAATAEAADVG